MRVRHNPPMFARFALIAALLFAAPAPAAAQTMQVAFEPQVVAVVLETSMGNITVEVDIERAPITAANFLRYVDQHRLDGTVFYRAMSLAWGEQPNGLIQGGTQYDPARILPPIAHERTSDTGLNHLRGAISMARYDPGTATGDFSIMLQTQPGMDADPDNADPALRDGYAAFGYVTDGMDVVEAIHAAPVDPDAGEGWMKGQMLAEPVRILHARRAQ